MGGKHQGGQKRDEPFKPGAPTGDSQRGGRHGGGKGNAGGGGDAGGKGDAGGEGGGKDGQGT
ncbi:hypothetical protein [Nonomuraea candida]|uniref:hypothetical protein n=1 Tax=Nonomuraea candida TaxID=359159 RepID=UPI0005B8C466|nr:hypothetical protein [Nonomuraea candida]